MRTIFARRPVPEFDDYTSSHQGAGEQYHQRFTVMRGRSLMWELEKDLLRKIVSDSRPRTILDFACGTGRISSYIEREFPEPRICGIDVSESMLDIAKGRSSRTEYRSTDSQGAISFYGERCFDLILAFRFFANAEPALRESVAADLSRLLADGGKLVINNHRNFWSTSYIAMRLAGQKPVGALNGDIEKLFLDQGFRIEQRISLGIWPQGDTHAFLLPWKVVGVLERANMSVLASSHRLGYNTVWVLAKG